MQLSSSLANSSSDTTVSVVSVYELSLDTTGSSVTVVFPSVAVFSSVTVLSVTSLEELSTGVLSVTSVVELSTGALSSLEDELSDEVVEVSLDEELSEDELSDDVLEASLDPLLEFDSVLESSTTTGSEVNSSSSSSA